MPSACCVYAESNYRYTQADLAVVYPNALELAAADAHDWHPDFIMKRWITFHLQCAA